MLDVAAKLRADGEHGRCPPREASRFTSVYVPDVVRAERGTFRGMERDARDGFELRAANRFLRDELRAVNGCLRPAGSSPGKLAVVGVAVRTLAREAEAARRAAGPVPSIRVDRAPEDDEECGPTVCVRVNDFVAVSNRGDDGGGAEVSAICAHCTTRNFVFKKIENLRKCQVSNAVRFLGGNRTIKKKFRFSGEKSHVFNSIA